MNQQAVCVEFLGLPGVGKSTLSHRVAELLIQKGIRVEQISYELSHRRNRPKRAIIKLMYVIKEIVLHPLYTVLSVNAIIKTRQKSIIDLCKVMFNWLFVSSLIRNNGSFNGIRVVDEGVFQALCSIVFSAKSGEGDWMEAFVSLMPLPRVVVVVEANIESIKLRLAERHRHDSRLEQNSANSGDLLMLFGDVLTDIKKKLFLLSRQHKEISVREVNNDSTISLEVNANLIAADLERIFTLSPSIIK